MKYYYKSLFDGKTEDVITVESEKLKDGFLKMYPDLNDGNDKGIEMRLANFMLGVDLRNKKKRGTKGKVRPWVYTLHRNEVISNLVDPDEEAA